MEGKSLIPIERIESAILLIRSQKVMLDKDLATLYGVGTKVLIQAVKRNLRRFPEDFMFQLTKEELAEWRSQIVTSNPAAKMGLRRRPYAFMEQGVAMLSSVLRSKRAVLVNVEIMRAFVRLRKMLADHAELARKLDALEKKYDAQFKVVFDAIRSLMAPPPEPVKPGKIGLVENARHEPRVRTRTADAGRPGCCMWCACTSARPTGTFADRASKPEPNQDCEPHGLRVSSRGIERASPCSRTAPPDLTLRPIRSMSSIS